MNENKFVAFGLVLAIGVFLVAGCLGGGETETGTGGMGGAEGTGTEETQGYTLGKADLDVESCAPANDRLEINNDGEEVLDKNVDIQAYASKEIIGQLDLKSTPVEVGETLYVDATGDLKTGTEYQTIADGLASKKFDC